MVTPKIAIHELAGWILQNYPYADKITHLKLQKLCFYAYGSLLSRDLENEIGPTLTFRAWEHGPVNSDLYQTMSKFGAQPITEIPKEGKYPASVTRTLSCAVRIYGVLDAWSLRQETHLEAPWRDAFNIKAIIMDNKKLKAHFKQKFSDGSVKAPEYIVGSGSFQVDGIPVPSYLSLEDLAEAVARISQGNHFQNRD